MSILHENGDGLPLSAVDWLDTHHSIKSRLRAESAAALRFGPEAMILDVGCGAGVWTQLLAERLGSKGRITGIDLCGASIHEAQRRLQYSPHRRKIAFHTGELRDAFLERQTFDLILFFNVLSYNNEPSELIATALEKLKPGGRIIIKDTDIGSDHYWPLPLDIVSTLSRIFYEGGMSSSFFEGYDPFFARKIPGILQKFPNCARSTFSQSYSTGFPVGVDERVYIRNNASLVEGVLMHSDQPELGRRWSELFSEGPECIFDNLDFMYAMHDYFFEVSLIA